MRHKTSSGFPLSVFLCSVCLTAAVICVGGCVHYSSYGPHWKYGVYIALLLGVSLAVGLITAFVAKRGGSAVSGADMSALSRKNQALEREMESLKDTADRREEFIASFAHELKTPLTAIIGYADMLRSKDMAPKARFTAAGYIFSEGKRLESLSLKLMDIIVAGRQDLDKKHYDAAYLLREISAVTVPSVTDNGMKLEVYWENGEVEVEPDLFKTLLINLIDNARKASKKGQTIELFGRKSEDGYAFYVRDHGRGMKAEELGKITEPFYMIDKSRSRAQNGAGLGLALCSKIAELHGTKLEYESELGKGTTVRVNLKNGGELI